MPACFVVSTFGKECCTRLKLNGCELNHFGNRTAKLAMCLIGNLFIALAMSRICFLQKSSSILTTKHTRINSVINVSEYPLSKKGNLYFPLNYSNTSVILCSNKRLIKLF